MGKLQIIAIVFLVIGIYTFIKAFSRLQVRDKRYNKGIKKRFNWISLIIFILSGISFYISYRFYYFSY
jgi:hypothetical protein